MTTVYVTHSRYVEHDIPGHPERPDRVRAVWQQLDRGGLSQRMKRMDAISVIDDLILTVHTPAYLDLLKWLPSQSQAIQFDSDTYATPVSAEIARLAAGGVVTAVDSVMSGQAHNGLAVIRPPGHHALSYRGMGFCILGNVPIAARYAQLAFGIERVMIVDFDVHHGNGTQDMFYDDPSVLFISTHQAPFYPGTGALDERGESAGEGYTINVPLRAGHSDASYKAIYEHIVWPAARRFKPELILVSAGFDAHWKDPLASTFLSLEGYSLLTHELCRMADELCHGRIVFALEGGYDTNVIAHGVRNIALALLGEDEISDPFGKSVPPSGEPDITPLIEQIRKLHGL